MKTQNQNWCDISQKAMIPTIKLPMFYIVRDNATINKLSTIWTEIWSIHWEFTWSFGYSAAHNIGWAIIIDMVADESNTPAST